MLCFCFFFFFSSRRRHTRWPRDWSSDVCSSDLVPGDATGQARLESARSAKWAYFLVGLDVSGAANRGTIVAIGDSITDGGSLRWPALLAARLLPQKKNYGVLN